MSSKNFPYFITHYSRGEPFRNKGYILNLKDISSDSITFTYGDSLLALNEDNRQQSGEKYKSELCKNIFRTEDLDSLFSDPRFPKTEPLHIEAQLWITPAQIIVENLEH